jgi:O-antigen polymerase
MGGLHFGRQTLYSTAVELIKHKPLLGYGIGSFPRVYADQTVKISAIHPDTNKSGRTISHPHNEVLLWMIEGGLLSVSGLVVAFVGLCIALYRSGFSRGGAYAALLFPISFHTQVELPFYGSSAHWFLWLFIIYIVFRHQLKTFPLTLSQSATYMVQGLVIVVTLIVLLFMNHTAKAQQELYDYKFNGGGNLQIPLDNLYFNTIAERIVMQNMLYSSMEQQDLTKIPIFIQWAEFRVATNPELGMFLMLSDAYGVIQDDMNRCRIAKRGLSIYTKNVRLQKIVDHCL